MTMVSGVASVDELVMQAMSLHQAGQLEQAKRICEQVLSVEPNRSDVLHFLGAIAYQSKDPQLAVTLIDRAIANSPDYAEAFNTRGLALLALNRAEEAKESFERAVALNAHFAVAFNNLGDALRALNCPEAAIASYDQAIAIKPDFVEAFNNRGLVFQEIGQLEPALVSFDKAIAIKPDFAPGFSNRGRVLARLKRYAEAEVSLKQGVDLSRGEKRRKNALAFLLDFYLDAADAEVFYTLFRRCSGLLWPEPNEAFDEDYMRALYKSRTPVSPWRRANRYRFLRRKLEDVGDKEGLVAECGCMRGLSSLLICMSLRRSNPLFNGTGMQIFDSFEGLSEPGALDVVVEGDAYSAARPGNAMIQKGNFSAGEEIVRETLSEFPGVELFRGWIPHAFPQMNERRYRFVHVDVDLYQPTLDSFRYFWPLLVDGGIMLCDDYAWPGAKKAVQEFAGQHGLHVHENEFHQAWFVK